MRSTLNDITQTDLFYKIGKICTAVTETLSLTELLEQSLKQTLELFGAKRGSIFILSDNGEELVLKAASGMKQEDKATIVKRMGEGIIGRIAQLKQPIFVDDLTKDNRFKQLPASNHYQTQSFICAPLLIKDQLIGVINITDKECGTNFAQHEMQLLDFLSTQIALNYRRVQLYHKFKNIVKETKNLKDKLGQTDRETEYLKRQITIQEKLATIGKLAGGIAHEFNNPLDGVMRYTNLCLDHIHDDEVVRGYLLEIKHGLNRMANIVKNLLACSRNETLKKDKVSLSEALEHAFIGLQPDIAHKNITIEKKLDSGAPMIPDLGLDRVLTNILHNAVAAINGPGRIAIQSTYENHVLKISISDTGCGIHPDEIDKIFEPFYTTKDIDKGCGLGLTIVSEIVKIYDGKIEVASQSGQGTTFTIYLPVSQ